MVYCREVEERKHSISDRNTKLGSGEVSPAATTGVIQLAAA